MFRKKIAYYVGNWAWLWKVVLFVSFTFSLGLPQFLMRENLNSWNEPVKKTTWIDKADSHEETQAVYHKVREFHQRLRNEADSIVKVNGWYSPYDYFVHLDEGYCFDEQSGLNGSMFTSYNYLHNLSNESMRKGPFSHDDVIAAKMQNLERYPDVDPNKVSEPIDWRSLGSWLWIQYLLGLPLALLWFLVNLVKLSKQEKYSREEYRLTLKSPLSLVVATLLYPIYFTWRTLTFFREEGKKVYTEAEVRRYKKKFLTLLSDDERALADSLVRNRASLQEIRDSVSAASGRIVYRGLFASMCATVIVMTLSSISPKAAQAAISVDDDVGIEHQFQELTDSHEITIGFGYDHHELAHGEIPDPVFVRIVQKLLVWPPNKPSRLTDGPPDTIFHVPVFVSLFLLFEILNQKISHEKIIVFSNSMFLGSCVKSSARGKFIKGFYL